MLSTMLIWVFVLWREYIKVVMWQAVLFIPSDSIDKFYCQLLKSLQSSIFIFNAPRTCICQLYGPENQQPETIFFLEPINQTSALLVICLMLLGKETKKNIECISFVHIAVPGKQFASILWTNLQNR